MARCCGHGTPEGLGTSEGLGTPEGLGSSEGLGCSSTGLSNHDPRLDMPDSRWCTCHVMSCGSRQHSFMTQIKFDIPWPGERRWRARAAGRGGEVQCKLGANHNHCHLLIHQSCSPRTGCNHMQIQPSIAATYSDPTNHHAPPPPQNTNLLAN